MARVIGFLVLIAAAAGGALVLITERAAVTRGGYRVARLERERRRLVEETRLLTARVAALKTPALMQERAKTLGVPARPPDEDWQERLKRQAESAQPGGTP